MVCFLFCYIFYSLIFLEEDLESVLSLISCISDASEYSLAASEAVVEFSSTDEEDAYASSDETEESFHSVPEDLYPTGSISEYSYPPSEADVELDASVMLYPQAYIQQLELPERVGCDTPAPEAI